MSALALLIEARRLIAVEGWVQGDYWNRDKDAYCARGALMAVSHCQYPEEEVDAWRALEALAGGHLTCWNDEPGRTVEDVLALYDRAIAGLEGE